MKKHIQKKFNNVAKRRAESYVHPPSPTWRDYIRKAWNLLRSNIALFKHMRGCFEISSNSRNASFCLIKQIWKKKKKRFSWVYTSFIFISSFHLLPPLSFFSFYLLSPTLSGAPVPKEDWKILSLALRECLGESSSRRCKIQNVSKG